MKTRCARNAQSFALGRANVDLRFSPDMSLCLEIRGGKVGAFFIMYSINRIITTKMFVNNNKAMFFNKTIY